MKTLSFSSKKTVLQKNSFLGFTLIEVIVTVAVLGVLMTTISAIFINALRNANQANVVNEAKENATNVLDQFERDVRNGSDVAITGNPNEIKITSNNSTIYWQCVPPVGSSSNGYIQRAENNIANYHSVTNRDATLGVNVTNCSFSVSGSTQKLVSFKFVLTEGVRAGGFAQEFHVSLPYQTSVGTRAF
jgi:prepilin-type N-terminal cleavage/methylation domain-containing protein